MKVHIGFTGTRDGTTRIQCDTAVRIILALGATDFHHGCCIGADAEIHQAIMFRSLDLGMHLHEPVDTRFARLWRPRDGVDIVYAPLPYLERNRAIVDATAALIATPKETHEVQRSGTWSTVRYVRRQRKPVHIVWPDGTVTQEPHP